MFIRDRSGATAIAFALLAVPVLLMVGAAVDYGVAAGEKTRLQASVDAAALATLGGSTTSTTTAEARTRFTQRFNAEFGRPATLERFEASLGKVSDRFVRATVRADEPTFFIALAGISSVAVRATADARMGNTDLEVVMVLDNSGSMADNNRIVRLQDGAKALVTTVSGLATGTVKYALVPFAALVNVGPSNAGAAWIDGSALSPVHSTNFDKATSRLSLYSKMKSIAWAGCVEARPNGRDVTDAAATTADTSSLFVPSFAPDEPDPKPVCYYGRCYGTSTAYTNSYLTDDGGAGCTSFTTTTTDQVRQKATCKYAGTTPKVADIGGTNSGPNMLCDSTAITPLTTSTSTITTAIGKMAARGGTNITEGLAWGWRVISPTAPFTEGGAYGQNRLKKVIVLMTDGMNTLNGVSSSANINASLYSAYGFAAEGRLGTTSRDSATLSAAMDGRLKTLCGRVKAAGVEVYTITYDVSDNGTRTLMRDCATDTSHAYFPAAGDSLKAVFEEIGKSVGRIRLAQ